MASSVQLQRASVETRRHEKYERLLAAAKALPALKVAVAHPCDAVLARRRSRSRLARDHRPNPRRTAAQDRRGRRRARADLAGVRIIDAPHSHAAAAEAVARVKAGEAEGLMKGSLHTDELMARRRPRGTA